MRRLEHLLEAGAQRKPDAPAAWESDGKSISYGRLDAFASSVAQALRARGVGPGERVGLCAPKQIASLASLFGVLKSGGAYVPVDSTAPVARNAGIFNDCSVRAVIVERGCAEPLLAELQGAWAKEPLPHAGAHSADWLFLHRLDPASLSGPADLAYVLYTSGSTGRPKGVMHSHASAFAFIDWCSEALRPTAADRFSSHAPFHFDLSILDIYVPMKHGASVVLIGSEAGKQPGTLASIIAERRITIWYSTPSILRMLVEYGRLEEHDFSALRIVNFAGEVFPIKHLRELMQRWPAPQYFNLYGPTETNVCTYYGFRSPLPEDRVSPLPIGRACSGDETRVVDGAGIPVAPGEEGELVVAGGSVMQGYWNLPDRTAEAFLLVDGRHWYRTGDIIREDENGDYVFVGRRDRMVKRRGYRVELGEIETALNSHPTVAEAGAIAVSDSNADVTIAAFVAWRGEQPFSLVRMKQYCAQTLPLYMVPDRIQALSELPKTSTDKIDYQRLKDML